MFAEIGASIDSAIDSVTSTVSGWFADEKPEASDVDALRAMMAEMIKLIAETKTLNDPK